MTTTTYPLKRSDEKTARTVKTNLEKLAANPHPCPGSGRGDREKVPVDGRGMYRLHIGRSYTALYTIDNEERVVRVREILPIDDAHKRYGF